MAKLLGVSRQAVVGWETGASYPSPQHLKHLIELGLQHRAFHPGQEAEEIRFFWESAKQRVPLDDVWLAGLLEFPLDELTAADSQGVRMESSKPISHVDWGDAPEVSSFYGRENERAFLTEWLLVKHCHVVTVLGMGGIGKTMLAAKLAQEAAARFEWVYWRSLRDAPPPSEWLAGAIGFLSEQQVVLSASESERLAALLQLLRTRHCLLVLDNFDTLFEPGQTEGQYRAGLEGYGRLLRAIGETSHQSCMILTSREAPAELSILGGEAVRMFSLGGLGVDEARQVLAPKQLVGSTQHWAELVARFDGNGLALKLVGEHIRELFGGQIGPYLEEAGDVRVFSGIRRLLAEQVERSSATEQQVLRALAVEREPMLPVETLMSLGPRISRAAVLEAVEGLRRRSLIERAETGGATAFTLQSVVLEYVTDRLVVDVADEIHRGQPLLLVEQPLIKALGKDYVRQSQERLIGAPIIQQLKARHTEGGIERLLLELLEDWRAKPEVEHGYGPGNVVNLLRLLRGDLRGLDFSHLAIRQAYLQEVAAQDASLAGAELQQAVLVEAFSYPASVALSADGTYLAAGTTRGELGVWRVADRTPLLSVHGHTGTVWGVALSADGLFLASGGFDGTVKLWEAASGRLLATLQGHTGAVWGVALSADGLLLASGGFDGTVKLWEAASGRLLATLKGHTGAVRGVALSADGLLVASGSFDGTVKLWEAASGQLLATLQGHTGAVWGVALSGDGQLVASGGFDRTVRLWEAAGGRLLATLQGHTGTIWGVALSGDGQFVASGSFDGTIKLWEAGSGRLLATLQGHTGAVRGVALGRNGRLLASGSFDGTVKLWETKKGRLLATLQGHAGAVLGMALSGDGQFVASGSEDGTARLWEARSGRLLATLQGHTSAVLGMALSADGLLLTSGSFDGTIKLWEAASGRLLATSQGHTGAVYTVALSADGQFVVSGSEDGTVKLWETKSGRPLATLQGHTGTVYSVALSGDGQLVASGSEDGMVKLWEAASGRLLTTLQGHTGTVYSVALSGDGQLVASGSEDGTVKLWEAASGRLLATLQGHTGAVWGVTLSADGLLVISGGFDGTVKLWEAASGRLLATLQGHTSTVWGVALSADGQLLASGSEDGTVRLWEVSSGTFLRTLRRDRPYERMDITGLTGITPAQRASLLALGAIEEENSPDRVAQR